MRFWNRERGWYDPAEQRPACRWAYHSANDEAWLWTRTGSTSHGQQRQRLMRKTKAIQRTQPSRQRRG